MTRTSRFPAAPRTILTALTLISLGLTLSAPVGAVSERELDRQIRERGFDPQELSHPLHVTDEMHAWLEENVPQRGMTQKKLKGLLQAILGEDGLSLQYQNDVTGTAEEVFRTRKANCLGFTQLFVALAREMDLDVYFLQVRDLQSFRQEGDLVINSGHVTAGTGPEQNRIILEFTEIEGIDYRYMQRLEDITALALYYSNRGTELLRAGDLDGARELADISVQLDPQMVDGWINLGVIKRRQGDIAGAERSYRQALAVDPSASTAYQNLAALYQQHGRAEIATDVLQLANQRDNRNPFTYIELGDISMQMGDIETAEDFYRKALRLDDDLAETHAALGWWAAQTGDERLAKKMLRRAQRIDDSNARVLLLAGRLDGEQPAFRRQQMQDTERGSELEFGSGVQAAMLNPSALAAAQATTLSRKDKIMPSHSNTARQRNN